MDPFFDRNDQLNNEKITFCVRWFWVEVPNRICNENRIVWISTFIIALLRYARYMSLTSNIYCSMHLSFIIPYERFNCPVCCYTAIVIQYKHLAIMFIISMRLNFFLFYSSVFLPFFIYWAQFIRGDLRVTNSMHSFSLLPIDISHPLSFYYYYYWIINIINGTAAQNNL